VNDPRSDWSCWQPADDSCRTWWQRLYEQGPSSVLLGTAGMGDKVWVAGSALGRHGHIGDVRAVTGTAQRIDVLLAPVTLGQIRDIAGRVGVPVAKVPRVHGVPARGRLVAPAHARVKGAPADALVVEHVAQEHVGFGGAG